MMYCYVIYRGMWCVQIGWEGSDTAITGFGMTGTVATDSIRITIITGDSNKQIVSLASTTGVTLSAPLPQNTFYVQGNDRMLCAV